MKKNSILKLLFIILIAINFNTINLLGQIGNPNLATKLSKNIEVDFVRIANNLRMAPAIESVELSDYIVDLPTHANAKEKFRVIENNTLSESIKRDYPNLRTYTIQMVANPSVIGDVTISANAYYAHYYDNGKIVGIYPLDIADPTTYRLEYGIDPIAENLDHKYCGVGEEVSLTSTKKPTENINLRSSAQGGGIVIKKKYDLSIAATGEFTQANGGTNASAMAVIANTVNCVNSIFNKDLAVCLVLVEACIFTDPSADPFIPENPSSASGLGVGPIRTDQAAMALGDCSVVSHDVGHVFHTQDGLPASDPLDDGWSGGGVAQLGSICGPSLDRGWSGSFNNTTNSWCQLATHEFGHMFGANHTWNGCGNSCGGNNIAANNGFEIASGTTIMSYNGICGAGQNIPSGGTGDNYFHKVSIQEMEAVIAANNCQTDCPSGNTCPEIIADPCGAGMINIPIGTPFKLSAEGTDADGDALTYTWEQIDEDGPGTLTQCATLSVPGTGTGVTAGFNADGPLFRSFPPSNDPTRCFPNDYKSNINTIGAEFEVLPQVARTINFAVTVRDCSPAGGGVSCDTRTINVVDDGPLVVNSPCGGGPLNAGMNVAITWNANINGSDDGACNNVDILMSTDGGCTFPYNLGTASYSGENSNIIIPENTPCTTSARFQVICSDNPCAAFFATTDVDCTINSACKSVITEISTDDAVCFDQGDAGLNFSLVNNFGVGVNSFSGTIDIGDPSSNLIFTDCASAMCTAGSSNPNYETYIFTPSVTGTYSFMHTGPFGLVLNLFQAPYTPGSCTNHIVSAAVRDDGVCPGTEGIPVGSNVSANLIGGVSYTLVVSSFNSNFPTLPAAYDVNITMPPGAIVFDGLIDPIGYEYTYLAVDQSTGNIIAVNANSDFTSLQQGCYEVFGAHFNNNVPNDVDPATFIGQSLSSILINSGDCVSFSSNSKKVTVKGTDCPMVTTAINGTESICSGTAPVLSEANLALDDFALAMPAGNSVNVTWFTNIGLTTLFSGNLTHSGLDNCVTEEVTLFAAVQCISDNSFIAAGSIVVKLYPAFDANLVSSVVGNCAVAPGTNTTCANYVITLNGDADDIGTVPGIGQSGINNYTVTFAGAPVCWTPGTISVTYDCPAASCPSVTVINSDVSSCSGELGLEVSTWQGQVENDATNAAAILDSNTGSIMYSSAVVNSNLTGCVNTMETMIATLNCFGSDGVDDSGGNDDVLLMLGTFNLTTFPAAQTPVDGVVGCNNTPTIACPGDVIGSVATNPTGGASVSNWDGTSYTAQPGDAIGTIDIDITTMNNCIGIFTIVTPACSAFCPSVTVINSDVSSCSGELGSEISVWQGQVENDVTNAAAILDSNTGSIIYSSAVVNSNLTGCVNTMETMTATLNCFGSDGVDDSGGNDDVLLMLGTFNLTTFPAAQTPVDGVVGCKNTPTIACFGDVIASVASNPTGGASLSNWDGTTYTAQLGDAIGTIDIDITTMNSCAGTFTITTPTCTAPLCSFVVNCPANTDLGDFNCNSTIPPCPTTLTQLTNIGFNFIDGPCGAVVVTCTDSAIPDFCSTTAQSITRTITIGDDIDASGDIDASETSFSCDLTFTIEANQAPQFTCPADITLDCTDDINDLNLTGDVVDESDTCTNNLEATFTDVYGPVSDGYNVTRTWTLVDACGNETNCDQIITVLTCDLAIVDPCSCLNNASVINQNDGTGGDDGQFTETVSITAPSGGPVGDPNLEFEVVGITGGFIAKNPSIDPVLIGSTLVYNPATMTYDITFIHNNTIGYAIEVQQVFGGVPSGEIYTVANTCAYPQPIIEASEGFCINDPAFNLIGSDQNGLGADAVTFTIDGVAAAIFDPSTLGIGMHTIQMTWDGASDGTNGVAPNGGVAFPGCVQVVEFTTEINGVESPTVASIEICQFDGGAIDEDAGTLTAECAPCPNASDAIVTWYSDATLTSSVATGSGFSPVAAGFASSSIPGVKTFYATCTCNGVVSCESAPTSANFTISPTPSVDFDGATDVICAGEMDGTITVGGTSGVGPYTIDLYAGPAVAGVPINSLVSSNSEVFTGLGGGTYSLEVSNFDPNAAVGDPIELTIEELAPFQGFMNVFELNGDFVFSSGWGVGDLVAFYNGGTLNLQPNQIADPNPFWYQGGGGPGAPGNKLMEALYFNQSDGPLAGETVSFYVEVTSNDFSCGHESCLFIRDFAPDFSSFVETKTPITAAGVYNVTATTINDPARHVQYGIRTFGVNVWSTDAPACGSIQAIPVVNEDGSSICSAVVEGIVINEAPAFPVFVVSDVDPGCGDSCDGSARIVAGPPTAGLEYSLDGGPFGQSDTFAELCAGSHTAIIRFANNPSCTESISFDITPIMVNMADAVEDVVTECVGAASGMLSASCEEGCDAVWYLDQTGGAPLFVGNDFDPVAIGLVNSTNSGTHTFWVDCECMDCGASDRTAIALIVNPAPVAPSISGDVSVCPAGTSDYTVDPIDAASTYTWTAVGGTITASTGGQATIAWEGGIENGSVSVAVSDANGCEVTSDLNVQVELNGTIVCKTSTLVSLGDNCLATIPVSIFVQAAAYDASSYNVSSVTNNATGESIEIAADGTITVTEKGEFTVEVQHGCSGNKCWGTLVADDTQKPTIVCPATKEVKCSGDLKPVWPDDYPQVADNCCVDADNIESYSYEDFNTVPGSDVIMDPNDECEGGVYRVWMVTDCCGNVSETCGQLVIRVRSDLSEITFPDDITLQCRDSFPGSLPANLSGMMGDTDSDGTVDIYDEDYPSLPWDDVQMDINGKVCQFISSYTDIEIQGNGLCDGSKHIIRTWTVFDWCSEESRIEDQFISIIDNAAPVVECQTSITLPSNGFNCEAEFIIPAPTVTDACSANPTFSVHLADGATASVGDTIKVVGSTVITYIAVDECGNGSDECTTTVSVEDNVAPIAVCDQNTVVSLGNEGLGQMCAETVDDGSYDNCEDDLIILVKRMDAPNSAPFTECVEFDCADAESTVLVRFRVLDGSDVDEFGFNGTDFNDIDFGECMVNVRVQDKIGPVITCPPSKRLNCGVDIFPNEPSPNEADGYPTFYNDEMIGYYPAFDNCSSIEITISDEGELDACGEGTITRTWTARDINGGASTSCEQTIDIFKTAIATFTGNSISGDDDDIVFPGDVDLSCESFQADVSITDPANAGTPQLIGEEDDCANILIGHEDQLLNNDPTACYKILRTWTVIDHCQFDAENNPTVGIWSHTQLIKVNDETAPVITCSDLLFFDDSNDGCFGEVVMAAPSTTDACDTALDFTWEIDILADGTVDFTGDTAVDGTYPTGTHSITWFATDNCGNTGSCTHEFKVSDAKKPTPVCIVLYTTLMPTAGTVSIWANDFESGSSFDNCTPHDSLNFYILPADAAIPAPGSDISTLPTSVQFDCTELGFQNVNMFVEDESGSWDYCLTQVFINDSGPSCDPSGGTMLRVHGVIETEGLDQVDDVNIDISGVNTTMFTTDDDGLFDFFNVPMGASGIVTPEKDVNYLNGVTTFDLVLISQHILGVQELDTPYKMIAADANKSNSVTTLDLVKIQRLILNIDQDLAPNTSWRFVDMDYVFPDMSNPFSTPFPEVISLANLTSDEMYADFIGVKIGDVNGTAIPNSMLGSQNRSMNGTLDFEMDEQQLKEGSEYEVAVRSSNFTQMLGYQYTINVTGAEVLEVVPGALTSEANFGTADIANGIITTSWHSAKSVSVQDEVLYTLRLKATTNTSVSKAITVSSEITKAESYTAAGDMRDIAFNFTNGTTTTSTAFELYQNRPNPFKSETLISFTLPQADRATISIMDISGKVLKVIEQDAVQGYNEVKLNDATLEGTGVLYYRLETTTNTATKKMTLIK